MTSSPIPRRRNTGGAITSFLAVATLFLAENTFAQQNALDSTKALVKEAYAASQRYDLQGAIGGLRSALRLAEKHSLSEMRGYCLNGIGEMLLRQGNVKKAKSVLRTVDVHSDQFGPPWVRARTLELLANADIESDLPQVALDHLLEGIRLVTVSSYRDSIEIANLYGVRGIAQRQLGQYAEAVTSLEESKRFRPVGTVADGATFQAQTWLGFCYAVMGENAVAHSILRSVVEALDTLKPEQSATRAIALSFLAFVEANEGAQRDAVLHNTRALEIAKKAFPGNSGIMADFYITMSDRYCDLGEFEIASEYARRANLIL